MKTEKIKLRILGPLTLAIVLMLVAFVVVTYRFQKGEMESALEREAGTATNDYENFQTHETGKLSSTIKAIMGDEEMMQAFVRRDREGLIRSAAPLFEELKREEEITHFYFTGPDGVNFLRVHDPERYGDKIERLTMREAQRTGMESHGMELGPLGTFTLRVVRPWKYGGRLLGFIELGIEVEHIIEEMSTHLDSSVFLFLRKELLDRKSWEEGMKMFGRNYSWERFPETVAVEEIKGIPEIVAKDMAARRDVACCHEISASGANYRITVMPLMDAGGRQVGHLSLARDVTSWISAFRRNVAAVSAVCLIIGGALVWFFYVFLGRVEDDLAASRMGLEESEKKYRELVDNALVGVYKSTAGGDILYANEALVRMMGFGSAEEMAAGGSIVRYRDPAAREELIRRLKDGGRVTGFEAELLTRKGESRYGVISATLEGEAISGMIMDITERRRTEESLRKVHEELIEKTERLERFQRLVLGREQRIMELKGEVNGLLEKAGEKKRYGDKG